MNHIRLQTAKLSPQCRSASQPRQSTFAVQADNLAAGRSNFVSQIVPSSQITEAMAKSRFVGRGNQTRRDSFCASPTKTRKDVQDVDHRF
jgi:hypothetical protein